jgi:hypothetical protein
MTSKFARGPTFIATDSSEEEWVGYEEEILGFVPKGFEATIRGLKQPGDPSTINTVARGDDELWAKIVARYNRAMCWYVAQPMPSNLRNAETSEWGKACVKSSKQLTGLQPVAISEIAPDGMSWEDYAASHSDDVYWRYRTKSGFEIPTVRNIIDGMVLDTVKDIRSDELDAKFAVAREDTNCGYPWFDSASHPAAAAIAYLSLDYDMMRELQSYVFRVLNAGHDMLSCLVRGGRVQENRRDLPWLQRTTQGRIKSYGHIIGGARDRDIYMGDRTRADVTRMAARYVLKALKVLFPQMDLGTPQQTYDKVRKYVDDTEAGDPANADSLEGDGTAFDGNVSKELLECMDVIEQVAYMFDDRHDLIKEVFEDYKGRLMVLTVGSATFAAALKALLGLASGITVTSTIANLMQCYLQSGSILELLELPDERIADEEVREEITSVWYGDDDLTARVNARDTRTRSFVSILGKWYARAGQDYTFIEGEGILKTFRGMRLQSRKLFSSIDSERNMVEAIRYIGTGSRWIDNPDEDWLASSTFASQALWRELMGIFKLADLDTFETPEGMFASGVTELQRTLAGKKQLDNWLADKQNTPFAELYSGLLSGGKVRFTAPRTFETRVAALGVIAQRLYTLTNRDHAQELSVIAKIDLSKLSS